jgi:hypothetical protein
VTTSGENTHQKKKKKGKGKGMSMVFQERVMSIHHSSSMSA